MVRKMAQVGFVLMLVALMAGVSQAQVFSKQIGSVNDFAHVLSSEDVKALTLTVTVYRNITDIVLVVATVPSLDGLSVDEYTLKLFKHWGIGEKDKNNGILLLLAPTEHRIRIEVCYGLEADLGNDAASEIIQKYAIPNFKVDNFSAGLKATVDGIIVRLGLTPFKVRLEERRRKK